ncbi:unnamed protein product [Cladocopium goreaui]|uniref:Uncharacterized protein n=1 Tax=Cladocopium goreaui TaxID=2562237 RepID=A0A9P1CUH4_9DINO|nr:unnamed protein product [Cladocopium goreaui]
MADDSLLRQLFFAVGDNSAINSSGAATASRAASSSTGANAPADRIGIADHVEDPEDTENQQEEQGLIEEMFRAFGGDHQEIGNEEPGILEESSASLVDFFGAQNHLENLGSMLQVGLFNRFLKYASKKSCLPDSSPAEGSKVSSTAALTSTIVSHFVHSNAMKSVAAVAEATGRTHKRVGTSLQRVASVMVHASGWMVGCCLSTWRRLFRSGRFKPVAVVDKMLYDETPLKMKIQEWNRFLGQAEGVRHQGPLQETYKFAKILRLDWQLSFIVWDSLLRRHKLITVALPVPLNAVDRNTSECLLAVIDKVHSVIPELEAFCNDFGLRIRVGRLGGWTNSDCTCDDENDYDYDLVAFFFLKIVSRDLMAIQKTGGTSAAGATATGAAAADDDGDEDAEQGAEKEDEEPAGLDSGEPAVEGEGTDWKTLNRILDGKEAAAEVFAIPACMRDELSTRFFELFPTLAGIRNMKEEYRNLSAEEFAHYKRLGHAVLDEGARAEDELKVIELEDAWTRLHELVQHSDQKELDFRNGGGKPFPITACSKLGRLTLTASRGDDQIESRTCLDFLKMYWNKATPCFVRFYTIVTSKDELIEEDMMLPKLVDVKLEPVPSHRFWRGSAVEFAPKISRHRKRKPDSNTDQKKGILVRKMPRTRARATGNESTTSEGDSATGLEEEDIEPDLDDAIAEMCPDHENAESEAGEADEMTECMADLIQEFFAQTGTQDGDACDSENDGEDDVNEIDPTGDPDLQEPVHPLEAEQPDQAENRPGPSGTSDACESSHPPAAPDSSSDPSSSSSSSSSSSDEASTKPPERRHVPTVAEAGAQSASVHDPSTITIGPLKIVKRFHPVPCMTAAIEVLVTGFLAVSRCFLDSGFDDFSLMKPNVFLAGVLPSSGSKLLLQVRGSQHPRGKAVSQEHADKPAR